MESSNNIAQYLFKNQKETIKASLIEFFKRNNLYATSEKYDHPEENNFSFNLYANIITFKCFRTVKEHIDLDVLIEITIEVTNLVDGELETKIYSDYYTLSINAILNNGIHDLNVYDIKYGSHVRAFDYRTSLNEFLVPYIRVQDYEVYAHQFLELYYPEALEKPMAVNPLILLERMGLSIYVARLDSEVNGKIVFADEYDDILDQRTRTFRKVKVKSGAILINTEIIEKGEGCVNNTIIHECIHWWLHKQYFELQLLLNPHDSSYKHYIDVMDMPDEKLFRNKYFMELQARSITPMVMMPRDTASAYYEDVLSKLENRKSYHPKSKTFFNALCKFANKFGASSTCARNRLENLGYSEVSFASKIGQDNGLRPFKSSVRLEHGQTYILPFLDAVKAFSKDHNAQLSLCSGKIIYVDGLFVLNDEKYVKFFKTVGPKLTELALSDVSKCCVLFDTKKEGVEIEFNPATFNFDTFCSDQTKTKYKNNPSISNATHNVEILDLKRSSLHQKDEIEEARDFISKMNKYNTFAEKLDCLLGDECLACRSDRGIGNKCHLDGKTITSYRAGTSKPDEKKLLAICAGLKLSPLITMTLLKANRIDIVECLEDPFPFYCHLIYTCYPRGLDEWNDLIRDAYPEHPEYQL